MWAILSRPKCVKRGAKHMYHWSDECCVLAISLPFLWTSTGYHKMVTIKLHMVVLFKVIWGLGFELHLKSNIIRHRLSVKISQKHVFDRYKHCLWLKNRYLIINVRILAGRSRINSSWPSDAIWRYKSGSTLAQLMAYSLTAPNHYLNQCWLN